MQLDYRLKAAVSVMIAALLIGAHTQVATAQEPRMVKDINPGGSSNPDELIYFNGVLYMRANDGSTGDELWKSDGTEAGTVLVKDINPQGNSVIRWLTEVGGTLFFQANDGNNGQELWKSDGTTSGTMFVKDINPGGHAALSWLTDVGGTLFFQANDGTHGAELWKSDGTEAGTQLVKDLTVSSGSGNSNGRPRDLINFNNTLYFWATKSNGHSDVWKSDGTEAGTVIIQGENWMREPVVVNGTLFFQGFAGTRGNELFKIDNATGEPVLIKNIHPEGNDSDSFPEALTRVGSTLFFNADDGSLGRELWKSDGTESGTVLVKDIHPGSGSSMPREGIANDLEDVDGTLFFRADDGTTGKELWKSDGTAAGTVLVKDIHPTGSSNPSEITNVDGMAYFRADDGQHGVELWRSDGTAAGTVMIKDIHPTGKSTPVEFTVVNGKLYFSANDGFNGRELWVLDAMTTSVEQNHTVPEVFALSQNYPNPFNPETTIQYHLGETTSVKLQVYDLLGRLVTTLLDEGRQEIGSYTVSWDGRDANGRQVASGVYVYRLTTQHQSLSQKMIFMK
ncbi:MAG: ELWxxDGT repeat protein [bacterium]